MLGRWHFLPKLRPFVSFYLRCGPQPEASGSPKRSTFGLLRFSIWVWTRPPGDVHVDQRLRSTVLRTYPKFHALSQGVGRYSLINKCNNYSFLKMGPTYSWAIIRETKLFFQYGDRSVFFYISVSLLRKWRSKRSKFLIFSLVLRCVHFITLEIGSPGFDKEHRGFFALCPLLYMGRDLWG